MIGRRGFIAAALLGGTAGHVLAKAHKPPTLQDLGDQPPEREPASPGEVRPCSKCGEDTYPSESHNVTFRRAGESFPRLTPDFYWVVPVLCFDCVWPS